MEAPLKRIGAKHLRQNSKVYTEVNIWIPTSINIVKEYLQAIKEPDMNFNKLFEPLLKCRFPDVLQSEVVMLAQRFL